MESRKKKKKKRKKKMEKRKQNKHKQNKQGKKKRHRNMKVSTQLGMVRLLLQLAIKEVLGSTPSTRIFFCGVINTGGGI